MRIIGNDWDQIIGEEFEKEYYRKLRLFLDEEYKSKQIYPPAPLIYQALRLTPYKDTKVVILGQDPYHEYGQAQGLSFSVGRGIALPPSLINIYKELHDDLGYPVSDCGDLSCWARQGVLLLNAVLTVQAHLANSHVNKGWEQLTDAIIASLNQKKEPVVFILWGRNARNKKPMITNPDHLIIESAHPSPLSAYNGFFGSRPFSGTNDFLKEHGLEPINWEVPDYREKP